MNSMYYRRSLRSFCSRSNINVQTSVLSRLANIFIRNNALKIGHLMCSISFHSIEKTLNKMACAIGTRNKLRIQFDFGKNTLIQFKLFTLDLFCFCGFWTNAIVKCKFCMYLYNNLAISSTQNTYATAWHLSSLSIKLDSIQLIVGSYLLFFLQIPQRNQRENQYFWIISNNIYIYHTISLLTVYKLIKCASRDTLITLFIY